jgi:hypothetical protein
VTRVSTVAGLVAALTLAVGAAGALADGPAPDGLAITLRDGISTTRHQLVCSPAPGGTLPDPAAACAAVRAGALVPRTTGPDGYPLVCTQAVMGPEVLQVAGRLDGAEVTVAFDRHDGCREADFQRVVTALSGGPGRPDALGPRLRVAVLRPALAVRAGKSVRIPARTNRNATIRVRVTRAGAGSTARARWEAAGTPRSPVVLFTGATPGPNRLGRGRYLVRVSAVDYLGGRATAPPVPLTVR